MVSQALLSFNSDEWETPQEFYNKLDQEFHFDLDPCSSHENHKTERYFTQEEDGLTQEWSGRVFVNPPYSENNFAYRDIDWKKTKIHGWIEKCERERERCESIVLLIPARTDTRVFHEYIYQKPNIEIRFIKWRLKFWWSANSAPFPSMVVVFKPSK